jgi:histidinol-phosphatase (PHP family)
MTTPNPTTPTYTANWHTHTFRCKHAVGDALDYAHNAADAGLTTLGFSDHMPTPDGRWISVRMARDELPAYREAVEAARQAYPALKIYCGLECEYLPEFKNYFADELIGSERMEYLILGAHSFLLDGAWCSTFSRSSANDPRRLHAYADYVIASIGTGLFACVAHPDVFGFFYTVWDAETAAVSRAIAQAARTANVPLEINAYGFRKQKIDTPQGERPMYPWKPFWEIVADVGAEAIVNSDAHDPLDIVGKVDQARLLAAECGVRVRMPATLSGTLFS